MNFTDVRTKSDLAEYHRQRGRIAKADRVAALAEAYFQAAPDDEPSKAAAMGMPVPRPRISTNAVSTIALKAIDEVIARRLHPVPSLYALARGGRGQTFSSCACSCLRASVVAFFRRAPLVEKEGRRRKRF